MIERDIKIMTMYNEGRLTFQDIADDIGVSRNTVSGVVHRNKEKMPKESFEERMKKYGLT